MKRKISFAIAFLAMFAFGMVGHSASGNGEVEVTSGMYCVYVLGTDSCIKKLWGDVCYMVNEDCHPLVEVLP